MTDASSEKHQRWRKYGAREAGWPPIRSANKEQIELLMMGSRVPIDEPVKSQPHDHSHTHDNTLANNVSSFPLREQLQLLRLHPPVFVLLYLCFHLKRA